jgi:hypothetical protein
MADPLRQRAAKIREKEGETCVAAAESFTQSNLKFFAG